MLGLFGLGAVLALDLLTFVLAFCTLLFFIRIPKSGGDREKEPVLRAAGLEVCDLSCELELDAFTVAICLPPILLNVELEEAEKDEALSGMAERYPVCRA